MKCLRHIPMAELMPPMLRLLLLQPEPELQHSALKALSNLVLDTASAKVVTKPPVNFFWWTGVLTITCLTAVTP